MENKFLNVLYGALALVFVTTIAMTVVVLHKLDNYIVWYFILVSALLLAAIVCVWFFVYQLKKASKQDKEKNKDDVKDLLKDIEDRLNKLEGKESDETIENEKVKFLKSLQDRLKVLENKKSKEEKEEALEKEKRLMLHEERMVVLKRIEKVQEVKELAEMMGDMKYREHK